MIKRQHVEQGFFDGADAMREALDVRFRDAYVQRIDWHYFCDPSMYTYLRSTPQRIFPKELFESFMRRLRSWCVENLGLVPVQLPSLHLMVNGCRLGLHSDFHNGTWGYVYSLTRWDQRRFTGGETLLLRDGIPSYKRHHVQGPELFELFPAHFNQLLVFDDRIVHATPTIEGSMDPTEGRIAMVGHIRATSPIVSGLVSSEEMGRAIAEAMANLRERIGTYKDVQGTITYRLEIGSGGTVKSLTVLTDNLVTASSGHARSDSIDHVKSIIRQTMVALKFSATGGESVAIIPVLVPLPDLQRIELSVTHKTSQHAIRAWAETHLGDVDELEFQGVWKGNVYHVTEPVAGRVLIEPKEIICSFDAPMWVPSQRESFKIALKAWAEAAATHAY